jgi:starch synthase
MNIAFVVSEMYPLIKTGGLADVAYALPKALKKEGEDVRVFLPKYLQLNPDYLKDLKLVTSVEYKSEVFNILETKIDGVIIYLVENRSFFERDTIYENEDRDIQFSVYSEVVLKALEQLEFKPDIIHCNDWQTGLVPFLLKVKFRARKFYKDVKTVFTIHNLRYQGVFDKRAMMYLDYPFEDNQLNFMKVGILNADKVNTVSRTYAEEIQTEYFGEGLEDILKSRKSDLSGIVNGIDYDVFDPSKDKDIEACYDIDSLEKKKENKLDLQKYFGLPENKDVAVISMVTRLVPQKGLDLIDHVIKELLEYDNVQIVILGSGMEKYEKKLLRLERKYPEKLAIEIGYNAVLANKIYAGSDMFLMPSQFEPCGLSQLISLKYGTIPVVRETGGLNDTVVSYNEFNGQGNGFSFTNYNAHDMMYTIRRAVNYYYNFPKVWKTLMTTAMAQDYSWDSQAEEYLKLYEKA